jgi:hypothetical protein
MIHGWDSDNNRTLVPPTIPVPESIHGPDRELKGFGLKVEVSCTKTYILRYWRCLRGILRANKPPTEPSTTMALSYQFTSS